ncbi:TfoX/Sxy family DNA transformation protein [Vibrio sp. THAF190c]|uniref:TfoX/Sxy family DNA transformation protein n=1 Tax=Vibrio sp. THAF190c TaxID=2587865 RepID=UPI001268C49E|nr:TfoX/Sxy family DNA transformation protein [Vibrio sp. THAF190c]QFT13288.1 hypothetical protein FIV04_25395 [Vibrio sp. THAF190c]
MAYSNKVFETYKLISNEINSLGSIDSKPLFFGLSININGITVGLITYSNDLIVRATPCSLPMLKDLSLEQHTYQKRNFIVRSGFFHYDLASEHTITLSELFEKTYLGALRVRRLQGEVRASTLNKMPNIKLSLAKKLKDIGIATPEELREQGAPMAFALIKMEHGDKLAESVLYKLDGAIKGVHEATISQIDRQRLKSDFNNILQELSDENC